MFKLELAVLGCASNRFYTDLMVQFLVRHMVLLIVLVQGTGAKGNRMIF